MSTEVMTIQDVRCYVDENGTAYLDAEAVARGLGFTMVRKDRVTTSGDNYEAVRWERVNGYLKEFGFPQLVGKGDFIPENMFYRLAMKANNAAAQKFQAKVADEILPSVRKHGVYMTPQAAEKILYNPDFIIGLAQQVKDAQAKIAVLEPKADYCDKVLLSDEHLTSELIAKEYGHSAHWLHATLIKLNVLYKRGRHYYLKDKYADKGYRVSETVILAGGKTVVSHFGTQAGREFIYWLLKKNNIVPLRERQALMAELL